MSRPRTDAELARIRDVAAILEAGESLAEAVSLAVLSLGDMERQPMVPSNADVCRLVRNDLTRALTNWRRVSR